MVSEQAIRQRSYEIWQREGCPSGKAADHWFHAKAELEAEFRAAVFPWGAGDYRGIVVPRVSISKPPQRIMSRPISRQRSAA
jgi:hypothetical protein